VLDLVPRVAIREEYRVVLPLPKIALIHPGRTGSTHIYSTIETFSGERCPGKLNNGSAIADILPIPYPAADRISIGLSEWLELTNLINRTAHDWPDVVGFVIVYGTEHLEEPAYFLSLTIKTNKTVVLIAARASASASDIDLELTLNGAIRAAIAPQTRGFGVLVYVNDEDHAAHEAGLASARCFQKIHDAESVVLGHVDNDEVNIYRKPLRRQGSDTEFDVAGLTDLPRVDIAYSYSGADGVAVDAFVSAGARGIVSAGFAPGVSTPLERAALERATKAGVVVVQSSRGGSGRVAHRRALIEAGLLAGDNLNPQKARALLSLALTRTHDIQEIRRIFSAY
jgi:L-asparaginase